MRRMRKKERRGYTYMENEYVIEMLNITKEFPGIKANDNITLPADVRYDQKERAGCTDQYAERRE